MFAFWSLGLLPLGAFAHLEAGQVSSFLAPIDKHLTCIRAIIAEYDGSTVVTKPGSYQEPSRFFQEDEWKHSWVLPRGSQQGGGELGQSVRIKSLEKIYTVMKTFFAEKLPGVRWWLESGNLLGAARTGTIIPWDKDGDVGVDMTTFNTVETMRRLNDQYGDHVKYIWSPPDPVAENVSVYPVSTDVVLTLRTLPTTCEYIGRFVDRQTGYFVEILDLRVPVESTENALLDGILVPVPQVPAASQYMYQTDHYEDLKLSLPSMSSSRMFSCRCSVSPLRNADSLIDPFKLAVHQSCDEDVSGKWRLSHGDVDEDCCKESDEQMPESIDVMAHRVEAAQMFGGLVQRHLSSQAPSANSDVAM